MLGMTDDDMGLITPLARRLYGGMDLGKIGAWGLLPLCCGWLYGGTFRGMTAICESTDVRRDFQLWVRGSVNVDQLVWNFHERLVTWINDPVHRRVGEARVQRLLAGKQATDEVRQYLIPYFSLAVVLQSIAGYRDEEFGAIKDWAEANENGWHWMFFGAGCQLADREDFPGQAIYSSFMGMNGEPFRSDLKSLFQHFLSDGRDRSGKSP